MNLDIINLNINLSLGRDRKDTYVGYKARSSRPQVFKRIVRTIHQHINSLGGSDMLLQGLEVVKSQVPVMFEYGACRSPEMNNPFRVGHWKELVIVIPNVFEFKETWAS